MLGFSTCWNNADHHDGEAVVQEIRDLGFEWIELSHGMTISKLPGLKKAYQEGLFKCAGVHNFFPAPTEVMIDAPDAYEFTHYKKYDRTRAFDLTLKTLETAAEFDAQYVVLHLGSNHQMPNEKWSKKLETMLKNKEHESKKYEKWSKKCEKKRKKTTGLYTSRALDAIERLVEKAKELNIKLALESRSHFEQIPSEEDMLSIQEHFKDEPIVGYWHDFGHVQRKHNLGLLDHAEWLEKMNPYLIGGHIHDVRWPLRDHRVPFQGMMNYDELMPLFDPELPLIWELSYSREPEDIKKGLTKWKERFPEWSKA